jgi:hypothetical protein
MAGEKWRLENRKIIEVYEQAGWLTDCRVNFS